jgi:ubiquinone/menaquinone biosynthesis C-methylase UbiE
MQTNMGSINENAMTGFHNAQKYDTHRPSYPADAVRSLLGQLEVADKPQSRIIDLAAGTGKLTEVLARRDEQYQILAVEPHPAMRQTLADKNLRGVEVQEGTAEQMSEVPDGWADAVIVAQVNNTPNYIKPKIRSGDGLGN